MNRSHSAMRRIPRCLCGVASLAALTLWTLRVRPIVFAAACVPDPSCDPNNPPPCCPGCPPCCNPCPCTGGGTTNVSFTTSTTHHTDPGCAVSPPFCSQPSPPICSQMGTTRSCVCTTTTFGPGTIPIGDDQSKSCFVTAGTLNINTTTDTTTFLCQLAPTLSPWALVACAAALAAYAAYRVTQRRVSS